MRILEAVRNDSIPTQELVKIISSDPALALKVLKVANSPVYTRSMKVATVKNAITVLGVNALKNIALSFVIIDGISANSKMTYDFESFWRRSITAAVSTEILSKRMRVSHDDLFISALLQDIGTVILSLHLARQGLEPSLTDPHPLASPAEEKAVYGFDHQEIGYEILREWGLPESICHLVRNHHSAEGGPQELLPKLRILALANTLSSLFHSTASHEDFENFSQALESLCRATRDEIETLIDSAHERTREILSFFEIDPGNMKTCSQILQEANEELGRLNLTYEQMVVELRQAKEKAENLAQELTEANSRLRELAYRDPLTGLFNHGHFQELLDRELVRASRYGHPLSLILFDLDHFKRVNDQHGHPTGDGVLKRIGEMAMDNVRACDYVARYGGEEFGVILPETDAKGSLILAERIRKTIESTEICFNDARIASTVSMGVATYYPGRAVKSKSEIIAAADRALYESKRQGRNRTCLAQF
jgi:diguanylate cyclase (GGDEF)-like protein